MPEKEYRKSSEFAFIVKRLCETVRGLEHIDPNRILVLEEDNIKGKTFASIREVKAPYNILDNYKTRFIMEFSSRWIDELQMTPAQKVMLAYHELLHIYEDPDKGLCLIDHNVKDFREIVDRYGSRWIENPALPNLLGEAFGEEPVSDRLEVHPDELTAEDVNEDPEGCEPIDEDDAEDIEQLRPMDEPRGI